MIKILNENFEREVKKELRRHKKISSEVFVTYNIDNASKTGTLIIRMYDLNVLTEITTPIEFENKIISHGFKDGKSINKIVFCVNPTDIVLDFITKNHHLDAWKNAYNNQIKIIEKDVLKDATYHISMVDFYNARRTKSTRVQMICFDGYEMIVV